MQNEADPARSVRSSPELKQSGEWRGGARKPRRAPNRGWPWTMSSSGAVTLGEIVGELRMLEVACSRCERHGRLSVAKLIERHGRGFGRSNVARNLPLTQRGAQPRSDDEPARRKPAKKHRPVRPARKGLRGSRVSPRLAGR